MSEEEFLKECSTREETEKFAKLNNISFEEAEQVLQEFYIHQEKEMEEVYESIIRGMQ